MDFTFSVAFHIPPWLLLAILVTLGSGCATIVRYLSLARRRMRNEENRLLRKS
jgi:hypothetical protein